MTALAADAYPNVSGLSGIDITSGMDGLYWGNLVSTMLFGITISQAWTYANDNRDTWRLRSFVAILISMDFAATCLNWQTLRFYLMMNFGNPSVLRTVTKPWAASLVLIETIAAITECFFASRIYLLDKKSPWAPILACFFAAGGFVSLTIAIHSNFVNSSVDQLTTQSYKILLGTGLGFTLSAVLLITTVLVIRLSKVRSEVKRTHSTVQKLLLFFVTRGLLVTITEVAFLIVYEVMVPTSLHWVPFLLLDPKVHIITMMSMLNSRQSSTKPDVMMMSFANSETVDLGPLTKMSDSSGASASRSVDISGPNDGRIGHDKLENTHGRASYTQGWRI